MPSSRYTPSASSSLSLSQLISSFLDDGGITPFDFPFAGVGLTLIPGVRGALGLLYCCLMGELKISEWSCGAATGDDIGESVSCHDGLFAGVLFTFCTVWGVA